MRAVVARISIAPVKALGLTHPASVELTRGGVRGDRRFWLVDEDGRLYNNKRDGPLVRVRPAWDEETRELALTFPDGKVVAGAVELGEPVAIELYGRPHRSRSVVGPWEEAISECAGRRLRLLWSEEHATDRGTTGGVVSLVSRASLERLREEAGSDRPVDGRRFRMLLELDGVPANAEDDWIGRRVSVGAAEIVVNGDVGRCVVTSHDPDTGVTDLDTLGTLARYRRRGTRRAVASRRLRRRRLVGHRPGGRHREPARPLSGARRLRQPEAPTSLTTFGPWLSSKRSRTPDASRRRPASCASSTDANSRNTKTWFASSTRRKTRSTVAFSRARGTILVVHASPRVVVADLDPGDDERGHLAPLVGC